MACGGAQLPSWVKPPEEGLGIREKEAPNESF